MSNSVYNFIQLFWYHKQGRTDNSWGPLGNRGSWGPCVLAHTQITPKKSL
ncbi:unnamed protein product [Staurois parvus]|uniref:Uncharacterized protein n=1 Tax=Staurois parvus TaxID=386267 RepID=A0ABN9DMZ7_9NEOB|nr:unnamed protein product [Staurois parvus]